MLISVITINYNNLDGLKKTMLSVFEQAYNNVEYIVIDGGSNDGSSEYIKANKTKLSHAVSETDEGIYDAMNKGIDLANGQYLIFLNSGDYFVNNKVLSSFANYQPTDDLVYGNVYKTIGNQTILFKMPEINNVVTALQNSLIHQAVFFSKALFQNNRYDTTYKIAADWVFINNAVIFQKCTIAHIDLVIVYYDTNGVSSDKALRVNDRKRYLEETFDKNFKTLFYEFENLKRSHNYLKKQFLVKTYFKLSGLKKKILALFKSN